MHWPTRQPAIQSDGRVLPNHPISIPMPAVAPPKVSFADALAKRGVTFPLSGWAPGPYDARCLSCQEIHSNTDKRSIQCLPCAVADQLKASS